MITDSRFLPPVGMTKQRRIPPCGGNDKATADSFLRSE
jgi:hypothetical protein